MLRSMYGNVCVVVSDQSNLDRSFIVRLDYEICMMRASEGENDLKRYVTQKKCRKQKQNLFWCKAKKKNKCQKLSK